VVIFMAMYYLLSGMIANFALALNILFVLAAMSLFEVIFTLPGIAGVILTMGMAVDANVLIFERLREEQAKDQSLRQAMRKAYERAFSAIIDGNITTLLTCVILAWVGTPEVRGFGITLGIGLVTSLFTSLLATRWIFRLLIDTKLLKNKVLMLRMVGVPKVDWLGKRRTFWAVSAVVIVVGLVSLVVNRGDILGIEFRQGTRATVRFLDDATIDGYLLTDARVEETLKKSARKLGPLYERLAGQNVQVNELKTESRVADFIATYDATASGGNQDGAVSKAEWSAQHRDEKVFALLDANGDGRLDKADLNKTLPEPRYQITTAESRLEPVREAIAKAFVGKLSTQAQVDYKLLSGEPIAELDLAITTQGYHLITKSDLDNPTAGGSFREELMDNVGGSLMAFSLTDPDQAMTPADLSQRLRNTRLQAGREDVYVVHPQILPLQNVPNTDKFSAFAVVVRTDDIDPANSQAMNEFAVGELELLEDSLRTPQSLESLTNFDAAMTARTSQMAIVAIILSWVAMILYLWFRFGRILWGLAAVICLIHDTFVVVGLVAACGWISQTALGRALLIEPFKIDMAMIAAVLTVIGYSVNDTIVVFDRIRENRGKLKSINPEIINHSLNQTLSRTLMTSFTTLIVVVVMYIWGGAGIHGFSFALMVGIVFGTYSSMAIASPLLLGFKRAVVAKLTKRRAVGVPAGK